MSARTNIDKQIRSSYPKQDRFHEKYDENWALYKKNFILLCEINEIPPTSITRLFRTTLSDSAHTLIDANFLADEANKPQVDLLFTQRYDSKAKQEKCQTNWQTKS